MTSSTNNSIEIYPKYFTATLFIQIFAETISFFRVTSDT